MITRILLSLVILIPFASSSAYADDAKICEGMGIYRPYTFTRKFQIAAAHLVNPKLLKKAKVIKGYSLSEVFKNTKIMKKYKLAGSANADIWFPISTVKGDSTWTTLSSYCILPEGMPEGTKIMRLLEISKIAKEAIGMVVNEIYVTLDPELEKLAAGSVKSKKFVAWNPKEKVISKDISSVLREFSTKKIQ